MSALSVETLLSAQQTDPHPRSDKPWLWKPGQSGNPKGRPAVGSSYADWLNELDCTNGDGKARYSMDDLRQISKDPTEQPSKRKAAQTHLRGETVGFGPSGKPLAGDDLDRISDRTVGKPAQAIDIRSLNVNIKRIELVDMRENQPALEVQPAELIEYDDGAQGAD